MLAAIKEMAKYKDEVTKSCHLETAEYLEACNKLFERGILSHDIIRSSGSPVLESMRQGFDYFERWHQNLSQSDAGIYCMITKTSFIPFGLPHRSETKKSSSKRFSCLAGMYS